MVASGIVVGALFQLLSGQGRFVERQSAREEVQQNTRAVLELIGSELRTVPRGDALVRATADSITFRTPRLWGVVCAVTGSTSLDVAVPAIAGASFAVNAGTGAVVNLESTGAPPLWSTAVGVTAIGGGAGDCGGAALPAGVERRSLTLSATPQNGATTPVVGNDLYVYDLVTYRTGTSAGVPGRWVQRRLGDAAGSTNQPMAGPIDAAGGLEFSYFVDGTPTPLPTPIGDAGTRAAVSRIQVVVEAVSRNQQRGVPQTKADTVVISLRNRA